MSGITVAAKIRQLRSLDIGLEVIMALEETSKDYAKLNTEQMHEGKLNDGTDIAPSYAPSTIARKKKKGQPFNRVTLFDTGKFYGGMGVQVDNDHINIDSGVDYSKYLEQNYTDKIFGLDPEKRQRFTFGPFWSVLKSKIEDITGLKFTN